MDKHFDNDKQSSNIEFNCSIVMDKELQEIFEAEKRCKRKNRIRIALGIVIGMMIAVFMFFIQLITSTKWEIRITGFFLMAIPSFLLTILLVCNGFISVHPKYYNRIDLMNLIPTIDEILDFAQISTDGVFEYDKFFIYYTLKNDGNKIVRQFELEGYKIEKSRAVKCLTINVDNFTILKPYQ